VAGAVVDALGVVGEVVDGFGVSDDTLGVSLLGVSVGSDTTGVGLVESVPAIFRYTHRPPKNKEISTKVLMIKDTIPTNQAIPIRSRCSDTAYACTSGGIYELVIGVFRLNNFIVISRQRNSITLS
jgi:hypothetical protein